MTANLLESPATDPTCIYRYRDGLYAADLLTAALAHLDFFTWLAAHPSDLKGICHGLDLKERPADVMITMFRAMGLLEKRGEVYCLTPVAREYLIKTSPWNIEPYFASLKARPVCSDLVTVLRTGMPANWGSFKHEDAWAKAMESAAFADSFTAAMNCRGVYLGPAMAKQIDCSGHRKLLDVAGGSGVYSCAMAARHPHLAATILEKPPVDAIARKTLVERGFADRITVHVADMFSDPFPSDCDMHLFSNVLHDWDFPKVEQLLAKSYAALPEGGMIIAHDAHVNEAKDGPLPVAAYSVMLMTITEGKCYSQGEMKELLARAGFHDVRDRPTVADRSVITAVKRGSR